MEVWWDRAASGSREILGDNISLRLSVRSLSLPGVTKVLRIPDPKSLTV